MNNSNALIFFDLEENQHLQKPIRIVDHSLRRKPCRLYMNGYLSFIDLLFDKVNIPSNFLNLCIITRENISGKQSYIVFTQSNIYMLIKQYKRVLSHNSMKGIKYGEDDETDRTQLGKSTVRNEFYIFAMKERSINISNCGIKFL